MPRHDHVPPSPAIRAALARERADGRRLVARMKRRFGKRRDGGEGETCPIEPTRPLDLSGGAAAALTFDD